MKHIILAISIIALGLLVVSGDCGTETEQKINATIYAPEELQLEVHNNDSFAWTNITITINDTYKLTADRMEAGSTYTVGLAQFTKGDGTRFNPLTQKVNQAVISCDQGWYGGER